MAAVARDLNSETHVHQSQGVESIFNLAVPSFVVQFLFTAEMLYTGCCLNEEAGIPYGVEGLSVIP